MGETPPAYNQFCAVCGQQLVIERDLEGLPETGCPTCDFAERREAMKKTSEAVDANARPQHPPRFTSAPTSTNSARLGEAEMTFSIRLLCTLQDNVEMIPARDILRQAQKAGLDMEKLYQATVKRRPSHWSPAPPLQDVLNATQPPFL